MSQLGKRLSPWLLSHLPLFLPSLLSFLLYLPALHYDFVMDDEALVVRNPYIKSWQYLPQMLSTDAFNISDPTNYWRPVFTISLALDYSLWGLNPFGFHLTNILLHAINAALLFSLGRKFLNTTSALFASLLFALHPIQAHAVSVVSTRGDLLAAFFSMLSFHAFLSKRTIPFAIMLTLALLSKETSMALPIVFLFAGLIIEKEKPDLRFILAFVILGLYLVVRFSLGFSFSLIPLVFAYHAPWHIRLLLAFKVLALYFFAIFNLFEMPHPFWTVEMPTSLNDPSVIGGILIFGLLLGAIWKSLKIEPLVAFGLLWVFIYFLPISNLKELNQPMAEHWLYIPIIGLCLAFGAALKAFTLLRLPRLQLARTGITAGVCVFLIFAALVVREKTKIYRDDESFFLAAIRANPQISRLYYFLGSVYLVKEDIPRAKEFFLKALALDPNDIWGNYMLGSLLYQGNQHDQAKIYLERVTQIVPRLKLELFPVAHAWDMLGDKQKALFYYRKALDLNHPESAQIRQKIATLEKSLQSGTASSPIPP
jgi:tetratricopeptide (TPR) repeat protein